MEVLGAAVLSALLIWQVLAVGKLKTEKADLRTQLQTAQLRVQASDVSNKSCQLALGTAGAATEALSRATQSAYSAVDQALQRAQDRTPVTASEVARLLSVRAPVGQDCQTATGLARAAWGEGQ